MGRLIVVLGTIVGRSLDRLASRHSAGIVTLGICKKRSQSKQPQCATPAGKHILPLTYQMISIGRKLHYAIGAALLVSEPKEIISGASAICLHGGLSLLETPFSLRRWQ